MLHNPNFRDIHASLVVVTSPRARRFTLRPDHAQRCIRLVMPKRASKRKAFQFAKDHQDWIERQVQAMPVPVPFEDGAIFPILGVNKRLVIDYNKTSRNTAISLYENEIHIKTSRNDITSNLTRYLKNHARSRIKPLAGDKAVQIGKEIGRLSLRDPKSRWGSCSGDGNLSFSWRLIFAPYAAFDYVIAHEVAHLKHLDHSHAFWQTCKTLSHDFDNGHRWMRENGAGLLAYGQRYASSPHWGEERGEGKK